MPTDSLRALATDRRIPTHKHIRFDDGGGANYPPPTDWRLARHVARLLFGDRDVQPFRKASVPAVRRIGSSEPPEPVSVPALVEQLRTLLASAPAIPDASPAYQGLTALVWPMAIAGECASEAPCGGLR